MVGEANGCTLFLCPWRYSSSSSLAPFFSPSGGRAGRPSSVQPVRQSRVADEVGVHLATSGRWLVLAEQQERRTGQQRQRTEQKRPFLLLFYFLAREKEK